MNTRDKSISDLADVTISTIYGMYPSVDMQIDKRLVIDTLIIQGNAIRRAFLEAQRQEAIKLLGSENNFIQNYAKVFKNVKVGFDDKRQLFVANLPAKPYPINARNYGVSVLPAVGYKSPFVFQLPSNNFDVWGVLGKIGYYVEPTEIVFKRQPPTEINVRMVVDSISEFPSDEPAFEKFLEAQIQEPTIKALMLHLNLPKDAVTDINPPTVKI
jgi:hypothetical protein